MTVSPLYSSFMAKNHKPVYILSGFLGAGKTTLLNKILREEHGHKFAVIVNEFGEVGLDGALIEGSQDFVKMDNGCLCCALNAELVQTIAKLNLRDDYDAVILETTGVADPLPIAWTFFREQFTDSYRFGGIVTVVDVLNFAQMTHEALEVMLQIERADYLYISKTSLVAEKQVQALEVFLKENNANARVVLDTDVDWLDLVFDFGGDVGARRAVPLLNEPSLAHDHKSAHDHRHDHKSAYASLAVPLQGLAVSLNKMEEFFEELPLAVFRAKAAFTDVATHKTYVMHAVCGRVEFYETALNIETPVCIFIGKKFDEVELKKDFLQRVIS